MPKPKWTSAFFAQMPGSYNYEGVVALDDKYIVALGEHPLRRYSRKAATKKLSKLKTASGYGLAKWGEVFFAMTVGRFEGRAGSALSRLDKEGNVLASTQAFESFSWGLLSAGNMASAPSSTTAS